MCIGNSVPPTPRSNVVKRASTRLSFTCVVWDLVGEDSMAEFGRAQNRWRPQSLIHLPITGIGDITGPTGGVASNNATESLQRRANHTAPIASGSLSDEAAILPTCESFKRVAAARRAGNGALLLLLDNSTAIPALRYRCPLAVLHRGGHLYCR